MVHITRFDNPQKTACGQFLRSLFRGERVSRIGAATCDDCLDAVERLADEVKNQVREARSNNLSPVRL